MTPFEIMLIVYGTILSVTAIGVVYRMVVGPTILDRAVSTDSLVVLVVLGMALYTAWAKENWAGPAMLSLTGLAFVGTVTFARFLSRETPASNGSTPSREPGTGTGPLDAIHVDHDGTQRSPTSTEPINTIEVDLEAEPAIYPVTETHDHFERGFGFEETPRDVESPEHEGTSDREGSAEHEGRPGNEGHEGAPEFEGTPEHEGHSGHEGPPDRGAGPTDGTGGAR